MIRQIFVADEFSLLPSRGLEAQKIRALYRAYGTRFDFCRFYCQGRSFLAVLDSGAVLCSEVDADFSEWANFMCACGIKDVFCSAEASREFVSGGFGECVEHNIMKFNGKLIAEPAIVTDPTLSEVYAIIREGFNIPIEQWYLDISHRTRHEISKCCTLDGVSALIIQHDFNGEALLSQVATIPAARGRGTATRLVRGVASLLSPSEVYVVCEDELVPFYLGCGFLDCGKKCTVYF